MNIKFCNNAVVRTICEADAALLRLDGRACESRMAVTLTNTGIRPVAVRDVALLTATLPAEAAHVSLYAEGYSMLSQYAGTLGSPECITPYSDALHYRMPQTEGCHTVYNLLLLELGTGDWLLFGYASCRRFRGEFRLCGTRIEAALACEDITLQPGETWTLEDLVVQRGPDREVLLDTLSQRIAEHHPRLPVAEVPTGWCSWYCYGPEVTEEDIYENLDAIAATMPGLRYVQIDDGYQAFMGDWLYPGDSFSSDISGLCKAIRERGLEPAIWLAPFIAEANSRLFRTHPEWFIMDDEGNPLCSDRVTFGGWNHGPWYMLDCTHPGAYAYVVKVVTVMREQWGCYYFKLDATMWGALPFGRRYKSSATSIEAYRLGMQAVLEGAGPDGFLLGGNSPMWGSLGAVHAMRVTGDIVRNWSVIRSVARECFHRNWQHGRLWVNDPDCVVLENQMEETLVPEEKALTCVTPDEFSFHAAYIAASGGMVLSGDRIGQLSAQSRGILCKLIQNRGTAVRFEGGDFTLGRAETADSQIVSLFNWDNEPKDVSFDLDRPCQVFDFFTDEPYGLQEGTFLTRNMPPHSGRVFRITAIIESGVS